MNRLSTILGIEQTGGAAPNLGALWPYMHERDKLDFSTTTSGGVARRLFAMHEKRCPGGEPIDMDYDYAAIAEIFAQNAGRCLVGEVTILGSEDTEQEVLVPEKWLHSVYWSTIVVSGDWELRRHTAHGGTLYRLVYSDEGYVLGYWFYVVQQ